MGKVNEKNEEIEFLRAIAIILVLVAHAPYLISSKLGEYTGYYWLGSGVDLFFCISGYVIARGLLEAKKTSVSFAHLTLPFFIKRISRLWPAATFWAFIVILGALFFNDGGYFGTIKGNVNAAVASVMQIMNFQLVSTYYFNFSLPDPSPLRVYWSLSLEEQFYFVFPIALFFLGARKVAIAALVIVLLQLFLYRPWPSPLWFFRTDALALGVLIAYFHQSYSCLWLVQLIQGYYKALLSLSLLILLVVVAKIEVIWFFNGLVVIISGLLVFFASFDTGLIIQENRLRKIMSIIGSRSYSLYLVHMVAMLFVRELFLRNNEMLVGLSILDIAWLKVLLYIILLGIFVEFSYRFIEQPLREKGRKFAHKVSSMIKEKAG